MSLSRSTSVYSGLDTVHLLGDLKTSRLFISKSDSLAYNAWKHLTGNSHLLNYCLGVELTKQLAVRVKTSFTFQMYIGNDGIVKSCYLIYIFEIAE